MSDVAFGDGREIPPPLTEAELAVLEAAGGNGHTAVAGNGSLGPQMPEVFRLEVATARELSALPDPPASDELLGPLVVRGQRVVLGGHTGEGKTTMVLAITRAVVGGEEFLDWGGRGGCRALVLDAEQGLKTIKRRLRESGLEDSDAVDYVRVPDGLSLDSDAHHVAEVERVLKAGEYGLVIADPLYKLHAGDSNDERAAVDLMRRFDAWRERYRFAFLLPVHCRKPINGNGVTFSIHELFGSSGYVRGAEVVLGLQRISNGLARLHFLKDRDGDLPIGDKWDLVFDQERGFRRKFEGPVRDLGREIETFLHANVGATTKEVREAVQAKAKTVDGTLESDERFVQLPPHMFGKPKNSCCWACREDVPTLVPEDGTTWDDVAAGALSQPRPATPFPPEGGEGAGRGWGAPRPCGSDDLAEGTGKP